MFGGNLPDNDEFTLALITNDEILAMNQKGEWAVNSCSQTGSQIAWTSDVAGSKAKYVAVFNTGDTEQEQIRVNWADLGLPSKCAPFGISGRTKTWVLVESGQSFAVKPHASAVYRITPLS